MTEQSAVRAHLQITGRVQGVFFRAHTAEQARQLALTGWVRNRSDGSVEVVAEGPRPQLERLIQWCHRGPPSAWVADVQVEWAPATGEFSAFDVRYTV